MDDWSRIPKKSILEKAPFISTLYRKKLYSALKTIYPHHRWKSSHFDRRLYWNDLNNQKKKLEQIGTELGVKELDDWYKVSRAQLLKLVPFIDAKYKGKVFSALKKIYPDHNWDSSKFSRAFINFWNDVAHQKKKLEEVGRELGVVNLDDWYRISRSRVCKMVTFISSHYKHDLFSALKTIYPDHSWNPLHFTKIPYTFWRTTDEQFVKNILHPMMDKYSIRHLKDWASIHPKDRKVFQKLAYSGFGSERRMLNKLFPEMIWEGYNSKPEVSLEVFSFLSTSSFNRSTIHKLCKWLETHPLVKHMLKSVTRVEPQTRIQGHSIDLFLPEWSLAVEYQGQQHYAPTYWQSGFQQFLPLLLCLSLTFLFLQTAAQRQKEEEGSR